MKNIGRRGRRYVYAGCAQKYMNYSILYSLIVTIKHDKLMYIFKKYLIHLLLMIINNNKIDWHIVWLACTAVNYITIKCIMISHKHVMTIIGYQSFPCFVAIPFLSSWVRLVNMIKWCRIHYHWCLFI